MRVRALVALMAFAFVQQTPAPLPPEAIFAHALDVVRNDAKAPYATYTVRVSVTNGGRRTVSSWATTEDMTHGVVLASSFSDEERANPTTPHGINVVAHRRLQLSAPHSMSAGIDPASNLSIDSPPVDPERNGDVVGPVALAVDQDFGLLPRHAYRIAQDDRTMADSADELALIGRTGAQAARYRVELLDTTAGIAHLALTPVLDPYHNRLRELWVDLQTGYVRDAIVEGVGDRAPFDRIRWHVTFTRQEGATYVSEAVPVEPLRIGGSTPEVRLTFEKLTLSAHSPIQTTFGIEAPVRYLRDP